MDLLPPEEHEELELKKDAKQSLTKELETDKNRTAKVKGEETKRSMLRRLKDWLVADKSRLGSIIFLLLFFILIIVLASLNLNFGSIMQSIVDWFESKIGLIGIYFGVFLISIFGNFTVIFPIPYTLALITVAVRPSIDALDIFILGLFAGGGAAIGETSAWLLGKASKKVMEDSMEKQVSRAKKWIDKGLAPLIIFLFAATPLPDDAVLVFIGLLGYPLWKTLIWCVLGKIVLTSLTGYVAKYFAFTSFGSKILWLFGLTVQDGSIGTSEPSPWISALVWIATIVIIGVLLFIDWGDLWNYLSRSLYKKKLLLLVSEEQKQAGLLAGRTVKEEQIKKNLKQKNKFLKKEESLWQCVLIKEETETPEYHDLYEIPFIVQEHLEPMLPSTWVETFVLFVKNSGLKKVHIQTLSKIKLPKKIKEQLGADAEMEDLLKKSLFIKVKYQKEGLKTKFKLRYLLKHLSATNEVKVVCLGEKEALTIRQIKAYDNKIIVTALVNLLKDLPTQEQNYHEITIGVSEQNASLFAPELE